ncbi:TetR/AcrR family transcriptional regulator [Yinghuangia soli]|uniref:TetR/AcrR family transcriptional regulator n=1 Tax=Yinghuangia soli TaxID=2908204 RepID=A0AA41U308_9ACTN|nr:TetR/AcrR family transcriptional regulator [Yinghuangia soli]MCF2531256.1 TetR/AcrR family transcriptional regulator [Yinghuangia soli]
MARPPLFDTTQLLDAAVRLAAASGPGGVTMSAVAKEVGAPSGSVYHRFPGRNALLAEVWLRTVESFQEAYLAALGSSPDPVRRAAAAVREVVVWSRANPGEAALLLHGPGAFNQAEWPAQYGIRADRGERVVRRALGELMQELDVRGPDAVDRITLIMVELPLSVMRPYLRAGKPLPPHTEALAEQSAVALLTAGKAG